MWFSCFPTFWKLFFHCLYLLRWRLRAAVSCESYFSRFIDSNAKRKLFIVSHASSTRKQSQSRSVKWDGENLSLLALMSMKITYRWANRGVAAVIVVVGDWARCLITAEISNINVVITCLIIANEAVTRQDCRWTMKVPVSVMLISSRNVCCRLDCWQILRFELVFESWWDGDEETNENNHCLVIKMREKERRKIWK